MFAVPELVGPHVTLTPLREDHRDELRVTADDARIWPLQLMRGDGAAFDAWFAMTLAYHVARQRFVFVVRQQATGQIVGSTGYLDIHPEHGRIEIGGTWYHPSVWGTVVNPACKLLLLTHAFDVLALNRVAFVVDSRNQRSQAAVRKLGATCEGILRSDRITHDGYVRDTVVFSILRSEWPTVRTRLGERLSA
jgi:RimJ/RimL family protein N-acetyltransferase